MRKQRDPGILSYVGKGLIRARVFPIEPKKDKKIQIRYEEILSYDAGVCRYQFALATNHICKIPIEFLKIAVNVNSQDPIRNIYSPSHDITSKREEEHEAKIKFSDENVVPDEDFQLIFSISKDPVGLNLFTYKEDDDEKGFFLLLAAPSIPKPDEINPKNVVFVLDRSGSMRSDKKIDQAKEALEFCLRSLNRKDNFAIVTFSDEIDCLTDSLTRAKDDEIDEACSKIKEIKAQGGTNIDGAMKEAFGLIEDREDERQTYILFLTDGRPTAGETKPETILEHIGKWNEEKCRIFVFGVGFNVNTHLLDGMSQKNKGLAKYVKPNEDIEVIVSSLYSKIANPVLADLKLDFEDIDVSKVYPNELPDLFSGSQLVVLGRYEDGGEGTITLTGKTNGEKRRFSDEFRFTKENDDLDYIPRLWGARRIGYLMDEIRLHGKDKELTDEVIRLSKKIRHSHRIHRISRAGRHASRFGSGSPRWPA